MTYFVNPLLSTLERKLMGRELPALGPQAQVSGAAIQIRTSGPAESASAPASC